MNRPVGLPASVRLPAELPDNLWPPPGLLERNATENIYVPSAAHLPPAAPRAEEGAEEGAEDQTEEIPDARVYVPPPPADRRPRPSEPDEADSPFIPAVLSRHDDAVLSRHDDALLSRHDAALPGQDDDADYVPAHSRTDSMARHAAPEASARTIRRRRRAVLLAYLLLVALVLVLGHRLRDEERPMAPGREAAQRAAEPAEDDPGMTVPAATPQAQAGETQVSTDRAETPQAGEFRYARSRGPMLGTAGRLYRFKVAVEKTVEDPGPAEFAEKIDDTLGDERSWINDGRLRMRRVPESAGNADFTIYLASAGTSEKMCATGGLETAGFTSCRIPGKVVINSERWADAVPDYAEHLDEYRRYTINHEVGHELGHGHEACPGEGEKAPVMMQQTYGLKGCTRNSWPYVGGKRYAGDPVA